MAKRLVLHDFRLIGTVSGDVGEVMQISVRTPLRKAFEDVAAHARKVGGLNDLVICCHGRTGFINDVNACDPAVAEGFGLQLADQDLSLRTVDVTAVLNATPGSPPLVNRIVVLACGPANTHPTQRGALGDGRRLMGEIALTTGARVIASSETQNYNNLPTLVQFTFNVGALNDQRIDFGEWEGAVYEFSPDDGHARKLRPEQHPRFDF